jgi:hypothetical protein
VRQLQTAHCAPDLHPAADDSTALLMLQLCMLTPSILWRNFLLRIWKIAMFCCRWRPAYLQPAADAERLGYLSGERGGIAAQQSDGAGSSGGHAGSLETSSRATGSTSSGGSSDSSSGDGRSSSSSSGGSSSGSSSGPVSPDNAVFLGLAPETGAPVFAADLGPAPPLLPDASRAAAAAAAAFPQVLTGSSAAAHCGMPAADTQTLVLSCRVQGTISGFTAAALAAAVCSRRSSYTHFATGMATLCQTTCHTHRRRQARTAATNLQPARRQRHQRRTSGAARRWTPGRPGRATSGWTSAARARTWRQVWTSGTYSVLLRCSFIGRCSMVCLVETPF